MSNIKFFLFGTLFTTLDAAQYPASFIDFQEGSGKGVADPRSEKGEAKPAATP
jgi:hypothetical protein